MILPASYANGFAPRDGQPLYPELWRGCVGAWAPCLGPTGLTLRDWSGFGRDGTLTNGPTWGSDKGRWALTLDGVNDYVLCGGLINSSTSNLTVAAWVHRTAASGLAKGIVSCGSDSLNGFGALIFPATSTTHHFVKYAVADIDSGIVSLLNEWEHVCWTVETDRKPRLYINGVLKYTSTNTLSIVVATRATTLGTYYQSGGSVLNATHMTGSMDDIRIYNHALNSAEIKLLASRRGIAYELAPVRYAGETAASYRRRLQAAQLIGGGLIG